MRQKRAGRREATCSIVKKQPSVIVLEDQHQQQDDWAKQDEQDEANDQGQDKADDAEDDGQHDADQAKDQPEESRR